MKHMPGPATSGRGFPRLHKAGSSRVLHPLGLKSRTFMGNFFENEIRKANLLG